MEQYSEQGEEKIGEREQMLKDYLDLAKKLSEKPDAFKFCGLNQEYYPTLKAELEALQNRGEVFGVTITPIADLIIRFKEEGMKVFWEDLNVFIIPAKCGSGDVWANSISPKHLQVVDGMDEGLVDLIEMDEKLHPNRQSFCQV